MRNFIKQTIIMGLALGAILSVAETYAASSLSSLAYGQQNTASSARSAALGFGGLSFPDSLSVSFHSPSAWTGPATTRFSVNTIIARTSSTDASGSDLSDDIRFYGAAFVFPVGKGFFAGVTLSPYTRLNYTWENSNAGGESSGTRRQGRGGLSQVLAGASFPIGETVRLGAGFRPIFGKIERLWEAQFDDGSRAASQTVSERYEGFGWSLSGNWKAPGGIGAGFLFNSPASAKIERRDLIMAGGQVQSDTTFFLSQRQDLPIDFTFGLGKQIERHLIMGQVSLNSWSGVGNPPPNENLGDGLRTSIGWEWTPESKHLDPMWRNFTYRAGAYSVTSYATSTLGHQPRGYAFTAGIGIPYAGERSRLDLALEIGLMGDIELDGVKENFIGLSLGVNHSEKWFVGRKERQ